MLINRRSISVVVYVAFISALSSFLLYHYNLQGKAVSDSFWHAMRTPLILGMLLSFWIAFWDGKEREKREMLKSCSACKQGTSMSLVANVIPTIAIWSGIAIWGFFYFKMLFNGDKHIPLVLQLPVYIVLVFCIILVLSIAKWLILINRIRRNCG